MGFGILGAASVGGGDVSPAGAVLALAESAVQINTAGTVAQQIIAATFLSDGVTPVDIDSSGGTYTCSTVSTALTWDLWEPVAGKTLRQTIRNSPVTAYVSDAMPPLSRHGLVFAAGLVTVYLRCKPGSNSLLQFIGKPALAADESPIQLTVRQGAFA